MTAWGLAQLPALPPPLLLEGLEAAVQGQLPSCSTQHTATILAAFAQLRHQPGEGWLREALQHCAQLADGSALGFLDAAQVLWALAMMGCQPGEPLLPRLLQQQVQLMGASKQQELGQSVWALSQLQASPGQAWLQAFEARSEALLEPAEGMCLLSLSSNGPGATGSQAGAEVAGQGGGSSGAGSRGGRQDAAEGAVQRGGAARAGALKSRRAAGPASRRGAGAAAAGCGRRGIGWQWRVAAVAAG